MATRRNTETGRFEHLWGVVDVRGEVEHCDHCGKFRQMADTASGWRCVKREQVEHLLVS